MIRVAQAVIGMRVVTPCKKVAKVIGTAIDSRDPFARVIIKYLDPGLEDIEIQAKLLKGYDGPPVIFEDERDSIIKRFGDRPMGVPLKAAE